MHKRLVCFLLSLLILLFSGCGKEAPPTVPTAVTTVPTETPATEAVTEAPTTEAPTEIPTDAPTEAPAEAPTEALRWTQEVHSGLREDGTFDEHTLFVGDSLTFLMITDYLQKYDCIGDAKYAVKAGAQVTAFFNEKYPMCYDPKMNCLYVEEFEGLTMAQSAAAMGEDLHALYLMMGTNYTPYGTKQEYIDICDFVLENCPNATVHLQLIPFSPIVRYNQINQRIREAYEHYQALGQERVMLIDTCTGIGNHLIPDKVHLDDTGRENWYLTLLAHDRDLDLPQ